MEVCQGLRECGQQAGPLTGESLLELFLSTVLSIEEPWRTKLRLNVLMVTEDASVFSANRKQMGVSITQKLDWLLRKKDQVPDHPDFHPKLGIAF